MLLLIELVSYYRKRAYYRRRGTNHSKKRAARLSKEGIYTTLALLVFWIGITLYQLVPILSPSYAQAVGQLVEVRQQHRTYLGTRAYVFDTGEPVKQVFYLDSFSKKNVFPTPQLTEQACYRITYDTRDKVILQVEEIQPE